MNTRAPTAAAYVLKVREDRRETLLPIGGQFLSDDERGITEAVPRFDHSRNAPLVVLACFADDAITHIADGSKGIFAGTGLVRLHMKAVEALDDPVQLSQLARLVPGRVRAHVDRMFESGGKLPPRSLGAVVDALLQLRPTLAARLNRFSDDQRELIAGMTETARANLGVQKDTLSIAMKIAGIGTEEVLEWSPGDGSRNFFLEGLSDAYLREDAALISDFSSMPGFEVIRSLRFAAKIFQSTSYPTVRLKVVMANRLALEEQTGADLIYYNETYRSFVMVQYKMMEKIQGTGGFRNDWEFRWRDGDKLADEIERMESLLGELGRMPKDNGLRSFRLHGNPFFLKVCPRISLNPDDKGLASGMYFPLDLWKSLASDSSTEGPHGGRVVRFDNVKRRFTNTEFIDLVTRAWVGTTVPQSAMLEQVVESVVQTGRTVTLAVKSQPEEGQEDTATADLNEFKDLQ